MGKQRVVKKFTVYQPAHAQGPGLPWFARVESGIKNTKAKDVLKGGADLETVIRKCYTHTDSAPIMNVMFSFPLSTDFGPLHILPE